MKKRYLQFCCTMALNLFWINSNALDFDQSPEPHLGHYAMGTGNWSSSGSCPEPGPHYIPDIENDFFLQFENWKNYYYPLDPFNNNTLNCDNPIPLASIDLFRSELDPLNICYYAANARYADSHPNYQIACDKPSQQRQSSQTLSKVVSNYEIFPVPFDDKLNIVNKSNTQISKVVISTIGGKKIKEIYPGNFVKFTIEGLKFLSQGVYVITIEGANTVHTERIVKL